MTVEKKKEHIEWLVDSLSFIGRKELSSRFINFFNAEKQSEISRLHQLEEEAAAEKAALL